MKDWKRSSAVKTLLCAALLLLGPAGLAAQSVRLQARVGAQASLTLDQDSLPRSFGPARAALWDRLAWTPVAAGLSWAEVELAAGPLGLSVRTLVVRLDPRAFDLRLELGTRPNRMTGAWTIDSSSVDAALAVNAGQFKETGPWGWVVLDGDERRDPGVGPLSVGIAVTDAGEVRWIPSERLRDARADARIRWAFQTYPLLALDGRVPDLARDGEALDQTHRDARLILAERPDGALLFVLTRYDGLGTVGERIPIGLTLPESIVLVEALGARDAAMLDGGISAQMLLRGRAGAVARWPASRAVPLGLVAVPRR